MVKQRIVYHKIIELLLTSKCNILLNIYTIMLFYFIIFLFAQSFEEIPHDNAG